MLGILHTRPLLWPWASPAGQTQADALPELSTCSPHRAASGPWRPPQTQADALPERGTSSNTWAESGPWPPPADPADALPELSTCPHTWASPGPGHLPETLQATTKLPVTLSQARKLRF